MAFGLVIFKTISAAWPCGEPKKHVAEDQVGQCQIQLDEGVGYIYNEKSLEIFEILGVLLTNTGQISLKCIVSINNMAQMCRQTRGHPTEG